MDQEIEDNDVTDQSISQPESTQITQSTQPSITSTESATPTEDNTIVEIPTPHKGPTTSDKLQVMLAVSDDYLFFVQYVPAGTLRPCWFLIQVNMEKNLDTADDGIYFCEFLQRHPSDENKTDDRSRWWPEWRELSWDESCTEFDCGRRILLSPRAKPDLSKYGKFSDKLNLLNPNVYWAHSTSKRKTVARQPNQSSLRNNG